MKTRLLLLTLALPVRSVWAVDVTGVWKAQFDTQRGLQKYTFTLQQDSAKVIGNSSVKVNGAKRESASTRQRRSAGERVNGTSAVRASAR